jgi:carbon monoxide dehydrogenase subunit G
MNIEGQHRISASRERVWDAINAPDVLVECIKARESLQETGDCQYDISVAAKIGPIKARFKGRLTIFDTHPPESYSMSFDVAGGLAGFGKGVAKVCLFDEGAQSTSLIYFVETDLGGMLAQLGSRLIPGVTKNIAEDFFRAFSSHLNQRLPQLGASASDMTQLDAS